MKERNDRNDDVSQRAAATPKRRVLGSLAIGGMIGVLLAGGAGVLAYAKEGPGPGGMAHHHRGPDPEAMRERMEFATDWMLSKVKATDSQKLQVRGILTATFDDLRGLAETHRHNRHALFQVLSADTVDRAQLEALRQSELALADRASRRITQALADTADVLTPEQRRELAERFRRFGPPGPMGPGPLGAGPDGEGPGAGMRPL
ncbi:MAG: Spy/CpxP family protein refolding chaperone [Burkholderiales bacterium]|nr:Spy/CpxP family protein refolding chaperone [Burkholderiales bacterium]